jgi:hypothetical protein
MAHSCASDPSKDLETTYQVVSLSGHTDFLICHHLEVRSRPMRIVAHALTIVCTPAEATKL